MGNDIRYNRRKNNQIGGYKMSWIVIVGIVMVIIIVVFLLIGD